MKKYNFTNRDVVIVLLVIIIICLLLYPVIDDFIGFKEGKKENDRKEWYDNNKGGKGGNSGYYAADGKTYELFDFDPNTADSTQLLRLGLKPWQVRNIYKYRAAGGRYRSPQDFARLYGLTLEQYKRLEPYIKIKKEVMAADVIGNNDGEYKKDSIAYPRKLKPGETVNINTADTSLLKRIPGIGSYYARQIVNKRQRLGGIAKIEQLKEIEGFPESAFQYMTIGTPSASSANKTAEIAKIRINQLEVKELAKHPYIRYIQAKEIFQYRRLRGPIKSASVLQRLPSFSPDDVKRLEPYLDYD